MRILDQNEVLKLVYAEDPKKRLSWEEAEARVAARCVRHGRDDCKNKQCLIERIHDK